MSITNILKKYEIVEYRIIETKKYDLKKHFYNAENDKINLTSKLVNDREYIENIFQKYKYVLVLLLPYFSTVENKIPSSIGSLSKDYHIIFKEKVELIMKEVKIDNYLFFTDTGPLFDQLLAMNAKIGVRGKNYTLINKRLGSFFYIGYVFINEKIESDNSSENLKGCYGCGICIKKCPTGAITEEKFLAERCLSYQTQTKELNEYSLKIKTLYGCDICQVVCPHNKFAVSTSYTKQYFKIDLNDLFVISNSEFKEKYRNSNFIWRPRNILKKNAIIAYYNLGKWDKIKKYVLEEIKKNNKYIIDVLEFMQENGMKTDV